MIPFKETALWQNLLEFSTRILTIVLCYVFCFLITTEYTENVLIILSKYFVQTPLNNYGVYFSYKNFLEGTNTIYSLSFYCTNLIIIPFILHQLYVFARKGLYSNERQLLFTILKYFYAFHSLFTIFFSEYLLPFMLSNLNELAEEFDFKHVVISFEPNLQEYLQLIKSLYLYNYLFFFIVYLLLLCPLVKLIKILNRLTFFLLIIGSFISLIIYFTKYEFLILFLELLINYFIIQEILNYLHVFQKIQEIEYKSLITVEVEGVGFEPTLVIKQ